MFLPFLGDWRSTCSPWPNRPQSRPLHPLNESPSAIRKPYIRLRSQRVSRTFGTRRLLASANSGSPEPQGDAKPESSLQSKLRERVGLLYPVFALDLSLLVSFPDVVSLVKELFPFCDSKLALYHATFKVDL